MKIRSGLRAGSSALTVLPVPTVEAETPHAVAGEVVDAAPSDTPADRTRFWEIDVLRGTSLGVMLGLHFGQSWLPVLSRPLAAGFERAWHSLIRPVCAITLAVPTLAGALLAAPFTHPRLQALRDRGVSPQLLAVYALQAAAVGWSAWWMVTDSINAAPFILLSGVSMAVSAERARVRGTPQPFSRAIKRGGLLLGSGVALSVLSALMMGAQMAIYFNVLHLLGLGTILSYPFLALPAYAGLAAGLLVVALGTVAQAFGLLNGLGPLSYVLIAPHGYDSAPLLPWFGLLLLGIAAGQALYPNGERRFRLPDLSRQRWVRALSGLSRNSLGIYLAQSPIAFAGVALTGA